MLLATERTDRAKDGVKIDLARKKRFFIFPNRFICVRVDKLNVSAPCSQGAGTTAPKPFACSPVRLGHFYKVNFLPRNLARPYIIGYIILQISGHLSPALSG
ncbi:MAG: hypothetical protein DRG63_13465 [Deltaproteobacteria bacterium]|nr:MAG: hypothetical protein DRG63_13465 [Deltaproteobacteria bacterium]